MSAFDMAPPALLRHLYDVAVARAHPAVVLPAYLPAPPEGRTVVIGAGKASGAMARAFDAAWPVDKPLSGTVITRYGHVPPWIAHKATHEGGQAQRPARIDILEAAHPVPDEAGLIATQALLASLQGLTSNDLVVALMSGGGSALLTSPMDGWTLQDEQDLHRQLLRCGAPIGEMNVVRRHLSAIKGGRLAGLCGPAPLLTLAISDVPGDRLEDIASGPTVPDPRTCLDALRVIERYGLVLPAHVITRLRNGELETAKPDDALFQHHSAHLIATPQDMLEAAAQAAREAGYEAHILSDRMEGEARDVGRAHAEWAVQARRHQQPVKPPCVLLSGGETTVTLDAQAQRDGSGGRCTELLLGAALALQAEADVWMLAADTDGIDGHSDAAGAVIGPDTLQRAQALGLHPQVMLDAHDSGRFFAALGDQLVVGPTSTNVNDFRAVLIA
jgi:hydroxypyruvate reductase